MPSPKKLYEDLVAGGWIRKSRQLGDHSLTIEARDAGNQACEPPPPPPPPKKSLWELTNHQVVGGVIAGLILSAVMLGIGWAWGRFSIPASQSPTTQQGNR
jgi:hypothetical protein